MERALRKTRIGVVVSNKMDKTVSVAIERKVPHPIYRKRGNPAPVTAFPGEPPRPS